MTASAGEEALRRILVGLGVWFTHTSRIFLFFG
jgi:hypothetical protein